MKTDKIDQTGSEFLAAFSRSTGTQLERQCLGCKSNSLWGEEAQRLAACEEAAELIGITMRSFRPGRDVSEQEIAEEIAGLLLTATTYALQLDPEVFAQACRVQHAKCLVRQNRERARQAEGYLS